MIEIESEQLEEWINSLKYLIPWAKSYDPGEWLSIGLLEMLLEEMNKLNKPPD